MSKAKPQRKNKKTTVDSNSIMDSIVESTMNSTMDSTVESIVESANLTKLDEKKTEPDQIDLSDETLDQLDIDIHEFNQTKKMDQKIILHEKIQNKTTQMLSLVDTLIQRLETKQASIIEPITNEQIGTVMDEIENLNTTINTEESIVRKIEIYESIMRKIESCKKFYDNASMTINYVN